jgi:hypothetical protein
MMKAVKVTLIVVALAAIGLLWLIRAMDYGDDVLPGAYLLVQGNRVCRLVLKPDHTFHQEIQAASEVTKADGVWSHQGEGHVWFSKEFLVMPGEERGASGAAFAEIRKRFGIFVRLEMRQYYVSWYGKHPGVSDEGTPGEYVLSEDQGTATLLVKPDHTFEQTMLCNGIVKHAVGRWTETPPGEVDFSKDFLNSSCEPLKEGETASTGGSRGTFLQIEIANSSSLGSPVFSKRMLWW